MAVVNLNKLKDEEININDVAEKLIKLEEKFVGRLGILSPKSFRCKSGKDKNVEYIYNPLEYAANLHNQYVRKYCNSFKKVMFLGMNPGPFGMVQTGVSVLKK